MAFVPGFEYDILVSYANVENVGGWVDRLVERLHSSVQDLTGEHISISCTPNFVGSEDLAERGVRSSALLLAVLPCPVVAFCRREWMLFEQAAKQSGGLQVSGKLRVLKVLKRNQGLALEPYHPEAPGFRFYNAEREFSPGDAEFDQAAMRLADEAGSLLKEIRARAANTAFAKAATNAAFLSYAREDSEFALRLVRDLRSSGVGVWLDQLDIKAGELWDRAVESALLNSSMVLVMLSPTAVKSENVLDEITFARGKRKKVIPLLVSDCQVPFGLHRLQRIDFRQDYGAALQQLLEAVRGG